MELTGTGGPDPGSGHASVSNSPEEVDGSSVGVEAKETPTDETSEPKASGNTEPTEVEDREPIADQPQRDEANVQTPAYLERVYAEIGAFQGIETRTVNWQDFAEPLPSYAGPIPTDAFSEIGQFQTALQADRVLFVTSLDDLVGYSAAHALASGLEGQLLHIDLDRLDDLPDFGLSDLLLQHTASLTSSPRSRTTRILLLSMYGDDVPPLLNALRRLSAPSADSVRRELATLELLVVCACDSRAFSRQASAQRIRRWDVPYLRPLLLATIPDSAVEVETRLSQQIARGDWPTSESVLQREISARLADGDLAEALNRNDQHAASTPGENPIAVLSPTHRVIQFVASFLPGLTPAEFSRVTTALLATQTETFRAFERVRESDGRIVEIEREIVRRLDQVWNERGGDALIRESGLRFSEGTPRRVMFLDPRSQEAVRRRMLREEGMFLEAMFHVVRNSQWLFDMSHGLGSACVSLYSEMITLDCGGLDADALSSELLSGLASMPGRVNRSAALLIALLDQEGGQERVDGVLGRMMQKGHSLWVARLITRIRGRGIDFGWLWIRRLMAEGEGDARRHICEYLLRDIGRQGAEGMATFGELRSWLSTRGDLNIPPSSLELCVAECFLRFGLQVAVLDALRDAKGISGPCIHPTVGGVHDPDAHVRFKLLLSYLLHPSVWAWLKITGRARSLAEVMEIILALLTSWVVAIAESACESVEVPRSALDRVELLVQTTVQEAGLVGRLELLPVCDAYWRANIDWSFASGELARKPVAVLLRRRRKVLTHALRRLSQERRGLKQR